MRNDGSDDSMGVPAQIEITVPLQVIHSFIIKTFFNGYLAYMLVLTIL